MKGKVSNRILSTYKVTYNSNGFVQVKYFVTRDDWGNILKPLKNMISVIENDNNGKPNEQSFLLKESLKSIFGDYHNCYPEGSPLHQSIKTGILVLPKHQGGEHKLSWKRI